MDERKISLALRRVVEHLLEKPEWNLSRLAEAVGTSRVTLGRWAKEDAPIESLRPLVRLYKLANASIDEAFGLLPPTDEAELEKLSIEDLEDLESMYDLAITKTRDKAAQLGRAKKYVQGLLTAQIVAREAAKEKEINREVLKWLKEKDPSHEQLVLINKYSGMMIRGQEKSARRLRRAFKQSEKDVEESPVKDQQNSKAKSSRKK